MNLFPGRAAGSRQQVYVDIARGEREERERREAAHRHFAEESDRRRAAESAAAERKLQERADQILAMTPAEHRAAAARLMANAEVAEWDRRSYLMGRANAHLGLAQTDRSQP